VQQPLGQPVPKRELTPPAGIQEVSCPTGNNVIPLTAGVDLSEVANNTGYTYELHAGVYELRSQILLDVEDSVTCYRGMGTEWGSVVIKATTGTDVRAFEVVSAQIGIFNLVFDGQDASAGVQVSKEFREKVDGRLTTRDVTMQRFRCAATESNCALSLRLGAGVISNTAILRTTCEGGAGMGCGLSLSSSLAR
jgi:hypothetical protein